MTTKLAIIVLLSLMVISIETNANRSDKIIAEPTLQQEDLAQYDEAASDGKTLNFYLF